MKHSVLPTLGDPRPGLGSGISIHPAFYVGSWMLCSNLTIMFNKWLLDNAGFRYPIILSCWHMVFATLATQIMARTTRTLDGRHDIKMTTQTYLKAVVPIGVMYSASMVCSNLVYLYLNVAFIQMLKSSAPFITLVISWLWGQVSPTTPMVAKISVIVFGVLLSSTEEIHFSWIGFTYQFGGLIFESIRVVMIESLLGSGSKMDPLVSLYYFAPVCAVTNFFVAIAVESSSFKWEDVGHAGFGMLFLNACVAFLLNITSVLLIGKSSGLVLHLTGILKNIILVIASVLIWDTKITPLQVLGYTIALAGFVLYRSSWSELCDMFQSTFGAKNRYPTRVLLRGAMWLCLLILVALLYAQRNMVIHGYGADKTAK
ncbi:triose-phosphate transporter [Xylariales sp. PMI_506]|nr:triose-phosphate transporter [Xylariales sp. PMI_506]